MCLKNYETIPQSVYEASKVCGSKIFRFQVTPVYRDARDASCLFPVLNIERETSDGRLHRNCAASSSKYAHARLFNDGSALSIRTINIVNSLSNTVTLV